MYERSITQLWVDEEETGEGLDRGRKEGPIIYGRGGDCVAVYLGLMGLLCGLAREWLRAASRWRADK